MSDGEQPALTPRQARLAERIDAIRHALELEAAARVDGRVTHVALWRPGEHTGWTLSAAGSGVDYGWLEAPTRSWASLAVAADAAWWMTPRAAGQQSVLVAFDASGAEVARWDNWWRLRQHAQVGAFQFRLRSTISPLQRWRLRGDPCGAASIDVAYPGSTASRPIGFGRLRIRWETLPELPELLCLFVTYAFAVRTLRMPTLQPAS